MGTLQLLLACVGCIIALYFLVLIAFCFPEATRKAFSYVPRLVAGGALYLLLSALFGLAQGRGLEGLFWLVIAFAVIFVMALTYPAFTFKFGAVVVTAGLAYLLLGMMFSGFANAQGIPRECLKYRRDLTRNVHQVWGLNGPVATFAAQLHQESACRADARSLYANGLAQFTPDTVDWIATMDPELASRQPFNPTWALRALVTYDKYLYDRAGAATPCDNMWFALRGYNGGEGWVRRDRRLAKANGADPNSSAAVAPFNAGRAPAMFKENSHYPVAIIRRWQPLYVQAGWGPGSCT